MNTEQERADFEAWCVTDCERLGFQITVEEVAGLRGPHGDYRERAALHGKWVGWQAGRAALQSQDRADILVAAMQEAINLLGPEAPICSGCEYEWNHALRALRAAIDHARRVEGEGE